MVMRYRDQLSLWTRPPYSTCDGKKNCIVKRAAKQVPRDKATSNLTPEVLHVNNID